MGQFCYVPESQNSLNHNSANALILRDESVEKNSATYDAMVPFYSTLELKRPFRRFCGQL